MRDNKNLHNETLQVPEEDTGKFLFYVEYSEKLSNCELKSRHNESNDW